MGEDVEIILVINRLRSDNDKNVDAKGWPVDLFEKTAGSLPDFPEIEYEGDFEERQQLA